MAQRRTVLFTAFEPSGDAVAAPVIAALRRHRPQWRVVALGGPRMEAAGAELLEQTTSQAVMLAGAAAQAVSHHRRLGRLRSWLREHGDELVALVPTDSPAANWSICGAVRRLAPGAKIVHLVAPQLWAWAPWRIGKLRRLTDHVLCLLPFEPDWLGQRGVSATFVGHPVFERAAGERRAAREAARRLEAAGVGGAGGTAPAEAVATPDAALVARGEPNIALLPGSRPSEVKMNWPTMLRAFEQLRGEYPAVRAVVAAADAARAAQVRSLCPGGALPEGMTMLTGDASAVLDWSDLTLVVSGTATLHALSRGTPMVVMYNVSRWSWELAGRFLIQTRTFTLPNLIGEWLGLGRVVPELVPHFGAVEPVVSALRPLMVEGEARGRQRSAFEAIERCFGDRPFAEVAVETVLGVVAR